MAMYSRTVIFSCFQINVKMMKILGIIWCTFVLGYTVAATDSPDNRFFPEDFSLGVATAAFQIEGAWNESGKGEQLWDWWMHTYPDKTLNRDSGDVACDSYHKWNEDLELLKVLGVNHYRLSISWSRILPNGWANINTINEEGVKYYRTLLEALIEAGITPYVTLYHWDLPITLHQFGGWQNPIIADHFAAYARICFELFGDIVKNWITLNEPHSYCFLGYGTGYHAPGYALPSEGVYKCAYTSVLAHAKAWHIYDEEFRATQKGRVSIVIDSPWFEPLTDTEQDREAVQRELDFFFGLYANPIYNGNWPEQVIRIVDARSELEGYSYSRLPKFTEEEIQYIKGTSDFFSVNTYSAYLAHHQHNWDESIDPDEVTYYADQGVVNSVDPAWASDVEWVHKVPAGFRKLLNYIHNTFGQPEIVVTENGWAQNVTTAGTADQDRITYLSEYLSALLEAIYEDGVNVSAYTVWSLMDNLEWANGYQQKLGLVEVDFSDPERTRTAKDSYFWYQMVTKNRCLYSDASLCI
uniref:Cytosolic beta-glucosidase n=1 Tax=Dendroctonus ponderosae TaxID=77166 RepID=A0AAR5P5R5_DENPD